LRIRMGFAKHQRLIANSQKPKANSKVEVEVVAGWVPYSLTQYNELVALKVCFYTNYKLVVNLFFIFHPYTHLFF